MADIASKKSKQVKFHLCCSLFLVWGTLPLCMVTSTASPTSASCLSLKATMMRDSAIALIRNFGNHEPTKRKVKMRWSQKNNQQQCHVQLRVSQRNSQPQLRKHPHRWRSQIWPPCWRLVYRRKQAPARNSSLQRGQLRHAGWGWPGLLLVAKAALRPQWSVQALRELLQADPGEPSGPQKMMHHQPSRAQTGLNW